MDVKIYGTAWTVDSESSSSSTCYRTSSQQRQRSHHSAAVMKTYLFSRTFLTLTAHVTRDTFDFVTCSCSALRSHHINTSTLTVVIWVHMSILSTLTLSAERQEWPDIKNYKWRLNPVWHRMLIAVPIWQQWPSKGFNLIVWWRYCMLRVICAVTDLRFTADQVFIQSLHVDVSHAVHTQCGGYWCPRPRHKVPSRPSLCRDRPACSVGGGLSGRSPGWKRFSREQLLTALHTAITVSTLWIYIAHKARYV